MRMAPEALARRLRARVLAFCCLAATCSHRGADVTVGWTIEPMPPAAAATTSVRFTLADSQGARIAGAKLHLDAHMAHPGMAPVTSDVIDISAGSYQSTLRLPMPGDWVFVVSGQLPDGRRITREIQVPGVREAETPAPPR